MTPWTNWVAIGFAGAVPLLAALDDVGPPVVPFDVGPAPVCPGVEDGPADDPAPLEPDGPAGVEVPPDRLEVVAEWVALDPEQPASAPVATTAASTTALRAS